MSLTAQPHGGFWRVPGGSQPADFGVGRRALQAGLSRLVITVIFGLLSWTGSASGGSRDGAPPSSDRPWSAPGLAEHQADLQSRHLEIGSNAEVDPRKVYELPDLIDLAQRLNPETKISWQRAKEALAAVGLKEVTYYPLLSAAAEASASLWSSLK